MKWASLKTKTKILTGIAVPLLLLVGLGTASITSLSDIIRTNGRVNHTHEVLAQSSGVVASAVEQQSSAAGEIARNVEQVKAGTQDVRDNISTVSSSAEETGAAATQVTSVAGELSSKSELLKMQVESFLLEIRAA